MPHSQNEFAVTMSDEDLKLPWPQQMDLNQAQRLCNRYLPKNCVWEAYVEEDGTRSFWIWKHWLDEDAAECSYPLSHSDSLAEALVLALIKIEEGKVPNENS